MKKKGFTLIELLAIIVILGALALIITPVVRDTIVDAKLKNFINSAYELVKAGELYYLENDMEGKTFNNITFTFPNDTKDLKIKGQIPVDGQMIINSNGDVAISISNGDYCVGKSFSNNEIIPNKNPKDCKLYIDESINGAEPELSNGMIPIIIDDKGWAIKSHPTGNWYNYNDKQWANAVIVTEKTRDKYMNSIEGTIIDENDILAYFVWVPRYKYKLWYTEASDTLTSKDTSKVHVIDIVFENKNTEKSLGASNGEYLTHPAFTFGEKELNGIWVAKFETGYSGATSKATAQINSISTEKIIVKPNAYSWRSIALKNAFDSVKNMNSTNNIFGLNNKNDAHLIKNIEWGAVAYLSHSLYGIESNVYPNNNSNCITGCGAITDDIAPGTDCLNKYGTNVNKSYNQSTTGNITGIFDLGAGVSEFVMGYNSSTTSTSSGFTSSTIPENKYLNIYKNLENSYSTRILGDATGELGPFYLDSSKYSSWYLSNATLPSVSAPWLLRGSGSIFSFINTTGSSSSSISFRITIS